MKRILLITLLALFSFAHSSGAHAPRPVAFSTPPLTEQAKLVRYDPFLVLGATDEAGSAVALSGDIAAVGVPHAGSAPGRAHVFTRAGTSWTLQHTLTASDGRPGDAFGAAVAVNGGSFAVSAPKADVTRR